MQHQTLYNGPIKMTTAPKRYQTDDALTKYHSNQLQPDYYWPAFLSQTAFHQCVEYGIITTNCLRCFKVLMTLKSNAHPPVPYHRVKRSSRTINPKSKVTAYYYSNKFFFHIVKL